jgi:Rps23 Pro-64 3,4-dihydroxylase Tpa1-like proline 4-hydroxylase
MTDIKRGGGMSYLQEMDAELGFLNFEDIKTRGEELSEQYKAGNPFPYIVIDDFLPPQILERCLAEFPNSISEEDRLFNRDQERNKYNFNPENLSPFLRSLFYSFNSRPFLRIVENITGIKKLVPDPYFLGAGLHEITQGGHLSVHADFNHHKPMNLERRINILIYLNKDWQYDYGGQLELWTENMGTKVQDIVPVFNRCVIFNTTSSSYHGNPTPVNHPLGRSRKSIALYYYTATWNGAKREHTTQFRPRDGSADQVDWAVRVKELALDLTPPILHRQLRRLKRA